MQDVYKNIEEYNVIKIRKILIAFDAMIADMIHDKNLNPVVTVLFIRGRKLNISSVFTMQSYFIVPKNVRINSTDYFIMKMSSKRELQQIGSNLLLDIDIKDFIKMYKKCASEPYSFLVNDTTLPSDNLLQFGENLLK